MNNIDILKELGIDTVTLFNRFCDNEPLAYKFLKRFPQDDNFAKLGASVASDDLNGIEIYAHTMKGLCANLELKELYELTSTIVTSVRAGKMDEMKAAFADLEKVYDRTVGLLRQLE